MYITSCLFHLMYHVQCICFMQRACDINSMLQSDATVCTFCCKFFKYTFLMSNVHDFKVQWEFNTFKGKSKLNVSWIPNVGFIDFIHKNPFSVVTLNTHTLPWSPFDCKTYYWPRNPVLIIYCYISSYNPVCHQGKKIFTCYSSKFQTSQDIVATCVIIFCCPKTGLGGDWRLSNRPRSPRGLILRVASITLKCHSRRSDHFCVFTYLCKWTGR